MSAVAPTASPERTCRDGSDVPFATSCGAKIDTLTNAFDYDICLRKPSKEFMCELRKRIVARAHDHDAIVRTG